MATERKSFKINNKSEKHGKKVLTHYTINPKEDLIELTLLGSESSLCLGFSVDETEKLIDHLKTAIRYLKNQQECVICGTTFDYD